MTMRWVTSDEIDCLPMLYGLWDQPHALQFMDWLRKKSTVTLCISASSLNTRFKRPAFSLSMRAPNLVVSSVQQ